MAEIEIKKYLEFNQPIGTFLVCSIPAKKLLKISSSDPRKYNEELDEYIGIQRELEQKKVDELKRYVGSKDASFPNSIITTIDMNFLEIRDETVYIKTSIEGNKKKALSIIDGQHRLASFRENLKCDGENFDLIVVIFLGLEIEEQAYLFSTINNKQKNLNSSLVQDLNDFFTNETPEKVVHVLTKLFNDKEESPWHNMIRVLGKNIIKKDKIVKGVISQYSFAKEILNLISQPKNYFQIRDVLVRTKNNRKSLEDLKIKNEKIFWKKYINGEDKFIYKSLLSYFKAIKNIFNEEWGNEDYILTKTTGYIAFMRFYSYLYKRKETNDELFLDEKYFEKLFQNIKDSKELKILNSNGYVPGAKGQTSLFSDLKKIYEGLY